MTISRYCTPDSEQKRLPFQLRCCLTLVLPLALKQTLTHHGCPPRPPLLGRTWKNWTEAGESFPSGAAPAPAPPSRARERRCHVRGREAGDRDPLAPRRRRPRAGQPLRPRGGCGGARGAGARTGAPAAPSARSRSAASLHRGPLPAAPPAPAPPAAGPRAQPAPAHAPEKAAIFARPPRPGPRSRPPSLRPHRHAAPRASGPACGSAVPGGDPAPGRGFRRRKGARLLPLRPPSPPTGPSADRFRGPWPERSAGDRAGNDRVLGACSCPQGRISTHKGAEEGRFAGVNGLPRRYRWTDSVPRNPAPLSAGIPCMCLTQTRDAWGRPASLPGCLIKLIEILKFRKF